MESGRKAGVGRGERGRSAVFRGHSLTSQCFSFDVGSTSRLNDESSASNAASKRKGDQKGIDDWRRRRGESVGCLSMCSPTLAHQKSIGTVLG